MVSAGVPKLCAAGKGAPPNWYERRDAYVDVHWSFVCRSSGCSKRNKNITALLCGWRSRRVCHLHKKLCFCNATKTFSVIISNLAIKNYYKRDFIVVTLTFISTWNLKFDSQSEFKWLIFIFVKNVDAINSEHPSEEKPLERSGCRPLYSRVQSLHPPHRIRIRTGSVAYAPFTAILISWFLY